MSKGLLSEQMGAMALVDELRHRRMEIEEHLDLPRREAEVAERIRSYYKSQGIACDDATVTQGVRSFFEQRLVFEAKPMNLWDKFLGRMIASAAFRFWIIFMLAFAIMFGSSFWTGFMRGFTKGFNESRAAHQAKSNTTAVPPAAPAAAAPAAHQEQAVPAAAVQQAITDGTVADGTHVTESLMRFEQLRKRFLTIPVNPEDHQTMQGRMATAGVSAALGGTFATHALDVFEAELNFLAANLTLEVANLPGLPSGVEIELPHGSGKKAWFIFVQPLDEQRQALPFLMLQSQQENAPVVLARVMAVEVSREEYSRIKQDKVDNNRIDKPVMGTSPAGNYRRLYDPHRTLLSPRFLAEKNLETANILDTF
ncbi:MAG TPA: hypothetical protein DIT18_18655 [Pseudomonas sp.]|nr:hypothetical protein [Pseudomonas sp.]